MTGGRREVRRGVRGGHCELRGGVRGRVEVRGGVRVRIEGWCEGVRLGHREVRGGGGRYDGRGWVL